MKSEIRKDLFGVTPKIGDIIVFNPVRYKGLVYGPCKGFMSSGLPKVDISDTVMAGLKTEEGFYTPKTGFVVKKTYVLPTEQEIEEEAELRYPVKTHSKPICSPFVGTQKTFIHGINWVLDQWEKQ